MKIGPVTPKITRIKTHGKNRLILANISQYWADLHQIFNVGRHVWGLLNWHRFAVAQATLV